MRLPLIIVNFKTYKEATGKNAVILARKLSVAAKKARANAAFAVQPTDIAAVAKAVKAPVLAQHVDPFDYGSHTGAVLPEAVKEAGAAGTLLNHSEHRIDLATLQQTIERCRKIKLATIVFANSARTAILIAGLKPDLIAVEPPELIGGSVSISRARPELISEATENIRKIPVLAGAGIQGRNDVEKAIKLGAKGIAVSSAVVKAKNPAEILMQLAKGLK